MPAVELNRLRAQILDLAAVFDQPERFQSALRELLDLHANRAYRAGQAVQPQPLLPSYRVAPLVMRQLELELSKSCHQHPAHAIDVVTLLWQDSYLEPRLLATVLLGAIPGEYGQAVTQVFRNCAKPTENFQILEALFKNGTSTLRLHKPDLLIALMEEWVSDSRVEVKVIGLRALVPLIEDEAFQNLPPVFRILSPVVQNLTPALNVDLQLLLQALIRRAPVETSYFLLQLLTLAGNPSTARLIRRCLPAFDPEQQASLRAALAAHTKG